MFDKTLKTSARWIALCFLFDALMLSQANPAQGTVGYIRTHWGNWGIVFFIAWFLLSAYMLAFHVKTVRGFFWAVIVRKAYWFVAGAYVLYDGVLYQHGAQWGAFTSYLFGVVALGVILWLLLIIQQFEARLKHDIQ